MNAEQKFEGWAVVEIMGHIRVAGKVTEQPMFGVALCRVDIPALDGGFTTRYFGGSSIYSLTPTTEDIARSVAAYMTPEPVHRYELPKPKTTFGTGSSNELDDDEPNEHEFEGGF